MGELNLSVVFHELLIKHLNLNLNVQFPCWKKTLVKKTPENPSFCWDVPQWLSQQLL